MVSELSEVGVQRCTIARSMWEHEFLRTQQGDAGVAMLRYYFYIARIEGFFYWRASAGLAPMRYNAAHSITVGIPSCGSRLGLG